MIAPVKPAKKYPNPINTYNANPTESYILLYITAKYPAIGIKMKNISYRLKLIFLLL
jgi:hypothetical protein